MARHLKTLELAMLNKICDIGLVEHTGHGKKKIKINEKVSKGGKETGKM